MCYSYIAGQIQHYTALPQFDAGVEIAASCRGTECYPSKDRKKYKVTRNL